MGKREKKKNKKDIDRNDDDRRRKKGKKDRKGDNKKDKKKRKISPFKFSLCLLLIIGLGVGAYMLYTYFKEKNEKISINPQIQNSIKYNNKTGFISDNYSFLDNEVIVRENSTDSGSIDDTYSNAKWIRTRVSDHNAIGMNLKYMISNNGQETQCNLKIGHWNALNFSLLPENSNSKSKIHANNIASVISLFEFDIIGLTEINGGSKTDKLAADNFIKLLNQKSDQLYKSNIISNQKVFDYVLSKDTETTRISKTNSSSSYSATQEKVMVIFDKNKVQNIETTDKTSSTIKGFGDFTTDSLYVRPPFYTNFNIIKTNKKITTIYSHFDSPGENKQKGENPTSIGNQGEWEIYEASNIGKVMNEIEQSEQTNNVVFMGDTNIGEKNEAASFTDISKYGYQMGLQDDVKCRTSLATEDTINKNPNDKSKWYANPYDKIIYKINKADFDTISFFAIDIKYITEDIINNKKYI